MEKKYKISEFANILGITPKTVYRMIEREEIVTVSEKVNNRSTTIVVITDDDLEKLKENYSKSNVNVGNYYENVTVNDDTVTVSNTSQMNNNNNSTNEAIELLKEYNCTLNDRLDRLNEELITSKSKQLLLEDMEHRQGYMLNEINELRRDNKQLMKDKSNTLIYSLIVIVILLLVITVQFTVSVVTNKKSDATVSKLEKVEPTIEKTSPVPPAPAPIKKNK